MKKIRTLFALLLTVLLLCGTLATNALADTAMTETGTVTITNALAGAEYKLYRVFDISGITAGGEAAFITNTAWHTVIYGLHGGFGTVVRDEVGSPITPNSDFNTNTKAQEFAKAALAAGSGITPDKTASVSASGSYTVNDLQYGFYIMVSSRLSSEPLYTVFTLKDAALNVTEKNPMLPNIAKTVNGLNATTADYNEKLAYQIVIAAAAGVDTYTVSDALPPEISYDAASLQVEKRVGGVTTPLTEEADTYTVTIGTSPAGGDMITIALADTLRRSLADGDEIVIKYAGMVKPGSATLSAYRNTATLAYEATKQLTDYARVYTGHISFEKQDSVGTTPLAGAKFVLKRSDDKFAALTHGTASGTENYAFDKWVGTQAEATVITTSELQHVIRGLAAGEYTLIETEAPDDYVKGADTVVRVVATTNTAGEVSGIEMKDSTGTTVTSVTIYNTPGSTLPETGGSGTTAIYAIGAALVVCALVLSGLKRRKNAAG